MYRAPMSTPQLSPEVIDQVFKTLGLTDETDRDAMQFASLSFTIPEPPIVVSTHFIESVD